MYLFLVTVYYRNQRNIALTKTYAAAHDAIKEDAKKRFPDASLEAGQYDRFKTPHDIDEGTVMIINIDSATYGIRQFEIED